MKITALTLTHWLCHRHLRLTLTPLTLIAGPNEAGKSAVQDALAFALLGDLGRVSAKGDRPLLLSTGATAGSVSITASDGAETVTSVRDIATGKLEGRGQRLPVGDAVTEAVPYVLRPDHFMAATPAQRHSVVLAVTGQLLDTATIQQELLDRGHELAADLDVNRTPEDWRQDVDRAASEARGGWKAVTGQTYGAVKAETWAAAGPDEPVTPESLTESEQEVAALRGQLAQLRQDAAKLRTVREIAVARDARIQLWREIAAKRPDHEASLAAAQALVTAAQAALENARRAADDVRDRLTPPLYPCRKCGTLHIQTRDGLVEFTGERPEMPATQSDLMNAQAALRSAEANLATAERTVMAAHERLTSVREAESRIAEITADLPPVPPESEISDLEQVIQRLETERLPAALDALAAKLGAVTKAIDAAEQTRKAASYHAQVKGWVAIGKLLEPDGLPAELLARAIGPFNALLSDLAVQLAWEPIRLETDLQLRRGSLPYGLLSESGRWKADLMVAMALARLSGLRFLALDRFDVLQPAARRPLLVWLYGQTRKGNMDSIILMGTLKEAPSVPADVSVHWLGQSDIAEKTAA